MSLRLKKVIVRIVVDVVCYLEETLKVNLLEVNEAFIVYKNCGHYGCTVIILKNVE